MHKKMIMLIFALLTLVHWSQINGSHDEMIHSQKFDNVYTSQIFFQGNHFEHSPTFSSPLLDSKDADDTANPRKKFFSFVYTKKNGMTALLENSLLDMYEVVGVVSLRIPRQRNILYDDKRSVSKNIFQTWDVETKDWIKDTQRTVLKTDASDGTSFAFFVETPLFAIGRGLCSKITELQDSRIDTTDINNPRLFLEGKGKFLSSTGVWKIEVLPHDQYLVRNAKFFLENGKLRIEITTHGTQRFSECVVPQKTTIVQPGLTTHEYTIDNASFLFNEDVFNKVVIHVDGELPNGAIKVMIDGKNRDYTVIGTEVPQSYELQPHSVFYRFLFIVVVNVIGIALILYLYFRNRRKK
jgi:hypothetical protein